MRNDPVDRDKIRKRRDAYIGSVARSLEDFMSFTMPKKRDDQPQDGPLVSVEDDLLVIDVYEAVEGEQIYADRRWVRFCLMRTKETGWLPNVMIDKVV